MNTIPVPQTSQAPYLNHLNPEQRLAVTHVDGPLLVLAGAGTGKTRVLIARLAHILIEEKAWPSEILAVTFTNKAAGEMRERTEKLMNHDIKGLWLGTFHSICARILRQHAENVGLNQSFTIINTDDQLRLMQQLLKAENLDDAKGTAKKFLGVIDMWKDRGLTPEKVSRSDLGNELYQQIHRIYTLYQERLLTLNAVDFGNLMLHVLTIFMKFPDILAHYQHQFKYIMVDEYQDTNVAQYLWLRLLSQHYKNICCVGDDDQSIYGWRGAEVGNILRFEHDFPGAQVVRLEKNYRSTQHILGAASGLISNNKNRLGKTLWTDRTGGDRVVVKNLWDGPAEARYIGEEIENLKRRDIKASQVAILMRASFQSREFEEAFLTLGLPYKIIGGLRFYERMEIRDAISYLRLAYNPHDGLAFERVINLPKRGLGNTALQKLHVIAKSHGCSLLDAAIRMTQSDELKGKGRVTLQSFIQDIGRWHQQVGSKHPQELAKIILDESGYTAMWMQDKSIEAPGRLENLKELVSALEDFEDLETFLEHVSLVSDTTQAATQETVTLMTIHSAKGLEFDHVFLVGWEEGIFPSQKTVAEGDDLEEERRLAYVALTRAKEQAYISCASRRRIYGQWQTCAPSRFINEIPPQHILRSGSRQTIYKEPFVVTPMLTPRAVERPSSSPYNPGDRVFHVKFGYGKVLNADQDRASINFDQAGMKLVMLEFLKPA